MDETGNVGCGDVTGVELESNPPDVQDVVVLKDQIRELYNHRYVVILNMFLVSDNG